MVECPAKLTTGADLILSLSIYMKPSAFRTPSTSSEDKAKVMFNEGAETEAEQILRERKRSLISLFKRINLKPRKANDSVTRAEGKLNQQDLELLTQQRPGTVKPTQSGNAEDDEEGDITEEQINLIYKKYGCFYLCRYGILNACEERSKMIVRWARWILLKRSR